MIISIYRFADYTEVFTCYWPALFALKNGEVSHE